MAQCPNCGKALSCGCQRRTASNGRSVCSKCISSYEKLIKDDTQKTKEIKPLNTWGKDRYKNLQKFVK
jgi:hypothetical protein